MFGSLRQVVIPHFLIVLISVNNKLTGGVVGGHNAN